MAWYRDHIYVGTTRANLCLISIRAPHRMPVWPVRCPADVYDLDLRAQIWRYDPSDGSCELVFTSPMVPTAGGPAVPRELGYRGMAVFKGAGDPGPALYVSNWPTMRSSQPPLVLRSDDGRSFGVGSQLSTDPSIQSFRALVPLDGHLYTSPTGRNRGSSNVSHDATVFETSDPVTSQWSPVSPVGFGDPANQTIFEMTPFNGFLYAATLNPVTGFQLWKCQPDGRAPYAWQLVLRDGAYRGNLNEGACSMCVYKDALYLGTGIQNGGYDRTNGVGPAAAELIRVHPDDSWDLVMGLPRETPHGFKVPLSGLGPGFNDIFNGYVWRMAVHNGWLYAGTYNWRAFLPYLEFSNWPASVRQLGYEIGVDSAVRGRGGFHLWGTPDGVNWQPITINGFENPYNCGVRTMLSTPNGLCVGTANPFGPDVAVKTPNGWEYVPNPGGGLEIWLGKSAPAAPASLATRLGSIGNGELVPEINQVYDDRMYAGLAEDYYGHSDFFNFGFWYHDTVTQKDASENLMEALISYIPNKTGRILDVACGKGATTRHLLRYYPAANVTGINISEKQLESCRRNAPGCSFISMDATDLLFADESFDAVICVESAFHFNTRARFFREAHRVLKPGGRLVLSDILVGPVSERVSPIRVAENYVANLEAYRATLVAAGFKHAAAFDVTAECKEAFYRNLGHFLDMTYGRKGIDQRSYIRIVDSSSWGSAAIRTYLLAWAGKVE